MAKSRKDTDAQQHLQSLLNLENQAQTMQQQLRHPNMHSQTRTTHPKALLPDAQHLQSQHHKSLDQQEGHGQFPNSIPQPSSLTTPPPNMEPPINETMDLDELEQFAHAFTKRRIKLGFTQKDVGISMKKLDINYVFSQTTISRFEALNMSFNNMCKLNPLLERWLVVEENSLNNSQPAKKPIGGKRKKRTIIEKTVVAKLELSFRKNPMPMVEDIAVLVDNLGMDKKVVQVWFYNRRARERRINNSRAAMASAVGNPHIPIHQRHGSTGGALSFLTECGKSTFYYRSIQMWNQLPSEIKEIRVVTVFDKKLREYVLKNRSNVYKCY